MSDAPFTPHVGQRVILRSLTREGEFLGTVAYAGWDSRAECHICDVTLDRQAAPVSSVIYFHERAATVNSSRWQICWPAPEETAP